jgi:hypothetical protein
MGARAEADIAAGEADELGDPQAGLGDEDQHGVVASASPGAAVGCGEEGVGFGFGEPGDQCALVTLGGDGEDSLDGGGVFGVMRRRVGEQRVDGGEPPVPGADRALSFVFEVVEERGDQRGVEVGDVERRGLLAGLGGGEAEQDSEGAAVAGDGVWGGAPLGDEPVGEERLEHWGQGGHDRSRSCCSRRAAASCMSSGTADKYQ